MKKLILLLITIYPTVLYSQSADTTPINLKRVLYREDYDPIIYRFIGASISSFRNTTMLKLSFNALEGLRTDWVYGATAGVYFSKAKSLEKNWVFGVGAGGIFAKSIFKNLYLYVDIEYSISGNPRQGISEAEKSGLLFGLVSNAGLMVSSKGFPIGIRGGLCQYYFEETAIPFDIGLQIQAGLEF
jgi:hypothetical protein